MQLRVLFVAYCFGGGAGQTLIGVYKRGLRVAMELCDRGHEVFFYCPGREGYVDDLTRAAETRVRFVDFDFNEASLDGAEQQRARLLEGMSGLDLDLVVVGEAPLAGALLEATLCAGELRLPVVILDNAYDRVGVLRYCLVHGPAADAIVLTGTSCQHVPHPPPWLCQVAPYVESSPEAARALIADLGIDGRPLVAVLAYDRKVQELAWSLLGRLEGDPAPAFLFMARHPEEGPELVATLPAGLRAHVRVITIPPDPVLFGIVQLSRLAIVKYGYMQVTECMALRTPVVAVYHEGLRWVDLLPPQCQRFLHVAQEADDATVAAAARLLRVTPEQMASIHDGELGAAARTAEFLERLPRTPRAETWAECVGLGFHADRLERALAAELGTESVELRVLRGTFLRAVPGGDLYSLLCGCAVDGAERFVRLWARRCASAEAVEQQRREAGDSERRVLFASPEARLLIEADLGQELLPAAVEQAAR